MPDYLFSARQKLNWGDEHAEAIKGELESFGKRDFYRAVHERNSDSTKHALKIKFLETPPWGTWALMLGDCLNNYRAALDHAVTGLAIGRLGVDPPAYASKLCFPISRKSHDFSSAVGRHWIGDLRNDASARAAIEGLQPYNRPNPDRGPVLSLLADLNNTDKHHVLLVAVASVSKGDVGINGVAPGSKVKFTPNLGPLEDGAEIVSYTFDSPAPNVKMKRSEVHISPNVFHSKTSRGHTHTNIAWIVTNIGREVRYCIDTLAALPP